MEVSSRRVIFTTDSSTETVLSILALMAADMGVQVEVERILRD